MEKTTYIFDPPAEPSLQWMGKEKNCNISIDTIPLSIIEQVTPKCVIDRLFCNGELPNSLQVKNRLKTNEIINYKHGNKWINRLIVGDSLLVMNSLLAIEHAEKTIQMIYLDPPYGINFDTAFQVLGSKGTPDKSQLPIKAGMDKVQAYNDKWVKGTASYLSHLRDRLLLMKHLLSETGSIFVQIGGENAHLVRMLLDEIFGRENYCDTITIQKTSGFSSKRLPSIADFVLWYAKSKPKMKYHPLYVPKQVETVNFNLYRFIEEEGGTRRNLTKAEKINPHLLPPNARLYRIGDLTSQGATKGSSSRPFEFEGKSYVVGKNTHWKTTQEGLQSLVTARRIQATRSNVYYVRFFEDFPVQQLSNIWTDTGTGGYNDPKIYAVQTNTKIIQRCILMTTDPGDLVFDPTCGSGTTAVVAEQWGRRWITCDTSRVAIFLARQRLLTASFPYYEIASPEQGVDGGFQYKTVPHIKLRHIAYHESPHREILFDDPEIRLNCVRVSGVFSLEGLHSGARITGEKITTNSRLFANLAREGLLLPSGARIAVANVQTCSKGLIHATTDIIQSEKLSHVAINFTSPYEILTIPRVEQVIKEAGNEFDTIILAGFHFQPDVHTFIQNYRMNRPRLVSIAVAFEVLLEDIDHSSKISHLFPILGKPNLKLLPTLSNNSIALEIQGILDPQLTQDPQLLPPASDITAWFLDENYDGQVFRICQAAFLGWKNPWQKIQRAMQGIDDPNAFQFLRESRSLPFLWRPGKMIAVKLVDARGIEITTLITLPKT